MIPPDEDDDDSDEYDDLHIRILDFMQLQHKLSRTKSSMEPFIQNLIANEVQKGDTRSRDVIVSDFYAVDKSLMLFKIE